jgi:hypothetical protein
MHGTIHEFEVIRSARNVCQGDVHFSEVQFYAVRHS